MEMIILYFGFWNPGLGFHRGIQKCMEMIMLYFGFWNPDLLFEAGILQPVELLKKYNLERKVFKLRLAYGSDNVKLALLHVEINIKNGE
jgi:hypothetical protein